MLVGYVRFRPQAPVPPVRSLQSATATQQSERIGPNTGSWSRGARGGGSSFSSGLAGRRPAAPGFVFNRPSAIRSGPVSRYPPSAQQSQPQPPRPPSPQRANTRFPPGRLSSSSLERGQYRERGYEHGRNPRYDEAYETAGRRRREPEDRSPPPSRRRWGSPETHHVFRPPAQFPMVGDRAGRGESRRHSRSRSRSYSPRPYMGFRQWSRDQDLGRGRGRGRGQSRGGGRGGLMFPDPDEAISPGSRYRWGLVGGMSSGGGAPSWSSQLARPSPPPPLPPLPPPPQQQMSEDERFREFERRYAASGTTTANSSSSSSSGDPNPATLELTQEEEDERLARQLQEEEYRLAGVGPEMGQRILAAEVMGNPLGYNARDSLYADSDESDEDSYDSNAGAHGRSFFGDGPYPPYDFPATSTWYGSSTFRGGGGGGAGFFDQPPFYGRPFPALYGYGGPSSSSSSGGFANPGYRRPFWADGSGHIRRGNSPPPLPRGWSPPYSPAPQTSNWYRGMTYEQLLALQEHIGNVEVGVPVERLEQLAPAQALDMTDIHKGLVSQDDICVICLAEYENGEAIRVLPCNHPYHKECIDKWLATSTVCAICKRTVGPSQGSSSSSSGASVLRRPSSMWDINPNTSNFVHHIHSNSSTSSSASGVDPFLQIRERLTQALSSTTMTTITSSSSASSTFYAPSSVVAANANPTISNAAPPASAPPATSASLHPLRPFASAAGNAGAHGISSSSASSGPPTTSLAPPPPVYDAVVVVESPASASASGGPLQRQQQTPSPSNVIVVDSSSSSEGGSDSEVEEEDWGSGQTNFYSPTRRPFVATLSSSSSSSSTAPVTSSSSANSSASGVMAAAVEAMLNPIVAEMAFEAARSIPTTVRSPWERDSSMDELNGENPHDEQPVDDDDEEERQFYHPTGQDDSPVYVASDSDLD